MLQAKTNTGQDIKKAVGLFFECNNRNGFYSYGVPGVITLKNRLDIVGYVDGKCFSAQHRKIAREKFWSWWKEYCIRNFGATVFLGSVRVPGSILKNKDYIVSV